MTVKYWYKYIIAYKKVKSNYKTVIFFYREFCGQDKQRECQEEK